MRNAVSFIAGWMQDYAEKAKAEGFVIGISGGVDSACVSTLCCLTGMPTLGLLLPCADMNIQHKARLEYNRAFNHCQALEKKFKNFRFHMLDIRPLRLEFIRMFTLAFLSPASGPETVFANVASRLRMVTLYAVANLRHYLVAGTGNKVEDYGIGFFTKYGDGGVDLNPLGELNKTQVRGLAKLLKVCLEIRKAAPTTGLYTDDRTDEDEIGHTYEELEQVMDLLEAGKPIGHDLDDVHKTFMSKHHANAHKMLPPPVCFVPMDLKVKLL